MTFKNPVEGWLSPEDAFRKVPKKKKERNSPTAIGGHF